jgi:hypothetical protein
MPFNENNNLTILLKNDDFVYSTKNVYLYFAVGLFLNKKTRIIDVLGVIFFLNKAIKVY